MAGRCGGVWGGEAPPTSEKVKNKTDRTAERSEAKSGARLRPKRELCEYF